MAKDHAKKFHEKVNKDAALRKQIREVGSHAAKQILAIGEKHGFKFTHAELQQAVTEAWDTIEPADEGDGPHTCFFVSERPES